MRVLQLICTLAVACAALYEAAAQNDPKYRYSVKDEFVVRRDSRLVFRAIETPAIGHPDSSYVDLATAFRDISRVGSNAVCFTFKGFSDDGESVRDDHVAALRRLTSEGNYRSIGMICKLFDDNAPEDEDWRVRAAATAAKTFERDNSMVYWIDGPHSDEAVKAFKKQAPHLVVAAPHGGDVEVVSSESGIKRRKAAIVVGSLTAPDSRLHCVLPPVESSYEAFDRAMAYPQEAKGWTPDNSSLTPAEREAGWVALFDGKTLNGWIVTGSNKKGWKVEDGVITWGGRGGGYLRTIDRYDDFILTLDWRIQENGNSGIMLRAPRANRASKIGFEFQLMGDHGKAPDKQGTAAIYSVKPPKENASKPHGEWNHVEIHANGPHVKALLNGTVVQDVNFDEVEELSVRLREGFIALQDHGRFVEFKNIRIKEL